MTSTALVKMLVTKNSAAKQLLQTSMLASIIKSKQAKRNFKDFPDPPKISVIGYPDQNKLGLVPKIPTNLSDRPLKMTKRLADVRGAELVHNKLIHKQYGIIALSGGNLQHGHFEMIRNTINKNIDLNVAFAIWRVDSPWKSITRHGQGKKLGGGKGAIDHYVTPVKRGRVIVEVGGSLRYDLAYRLLIDVAQKLPFPAKFVTQEDMKEIDNLEEKLKRENINKLRWEWCLKNNIMNVANYVGKYDLEFSHLGPDCR